MKRETPVIDFYVNEIKDLMAGKYYYCARRKQNIYAKFGILASLADRPEKSFILKKSLLGKFGKIA